jgi:hypothetical protein
MLSSTQATRTSAGERTEGAKECGVERRRKKMRERRSTDQAPASLLRAARGLLASNVRLMWMMELRAPTFRLVFS